MARIGVGTLDELYDPISNQAGSAQIDNVEPFPMLTARTGSPLCSASSRYDPSGLIYYTEIVPEGEKDQLDWLEDLEDLEDLRMLQDMRKRPLKFRKFEDFMKEREPGV